MVKGICIDCPRTEDHWFCKGRCAACHKRHVRRTKRAVVLCAVCSKPVDSYEQIVAAYTAWAKLDSYVRTMYGAPEG